MTGIRWIGTGAPVRWAAAVCRRDSSLSNSSPLLPGTSCRESLSLPGALTVTSQRTLDLLQWEGWDRQPHPLRQVLLNIEPGRFLCWIVVRYRRFNPISVIRGLFPKNVQTVKFGLLLLRDPLLTIRLSGWNLSRSRSLFSYRCLLVAACRSRPDREHVGRWRIQQAF